MTEYPDATAPLGPIDQYDHWVRVPDGPYNLEGWDIEATWYTDQYRNEYNSVEHVLRCAIAEALNVVRA